jgi:hypothetical protein
MTNLDAIRVVLGHVGVLVDPTTGPMPTRSVNTDGILKFMITTVAPILLAALGIVVLARSRRGEMSATMNSTAIALVGIALLGGATSLVFLGGWLVDMAIK